MILFLTSNTYPTHIINALVSIPVMNQDTPFKNTL